jgi:hypothetical protein
MKYGKLNCGGKMDRNFLADAGFDVIKLLCCGKRLKIHVVQKIIQLLTNQVNNAARKELQ